MLQFNINRDRDPNDKSLRILLEAHFRYERMSAAKSLCLHLLTVVGVIVWLAAAWPFLLPSELQLFVLVLWGGLFFIAVWTGFEEWLWHRKVARYRDGHQAKQKQRPG